MTALELCNDLGAARLDQFGSGDQPTRVYPSVYFDYGVEVIAPDGTPTQRAPRYCATTLAASQLAQILGASSIVLGNAINFTGLLDSWNDTKLVPHLIFTRDGVSSKPINGGVLCDMFNGTSFPATQQDADRAMANAQFEIKGAF